MKPSLIVLIIIAVLENVSAAPTVAEILDKIEARERLTYDFTAKMKILEEQEGQGIKVMEYLFYRKDSRDSFLLISIAPEADKGNGYLSVNENMWLYKKNTRTFQLINRSENVNDTDAKIGDFEKNKLSALYDPLMDEAGKEIILEEELGKDRIKVYVFKIIANNKNVTYPQQKLWVKKDDLLLLKAEYYSLSGELLETYYRLKYTQIGSQYFALRHMYVDEFENRKTVVDFESISTQPIDDLIFTKAYLENLSK